MASAQRGFEKMLKSSCMDKIVIGVQETADSVSPIVRSLAKCSAEDPARCRLQAVHDSSDGFDLGKDSEASTSSSSSSSYSSSARAETVTVAAMNNNTASRRARHSRRLSRVGARRGSFRSTTKALGFISQAAQRMSSSAYAFV